MFALFPEILHAAEKGDPEALALLVRKYFGESQTYAPRLRVSDLFRSVGIDVKLEAVPGFARLEAWDSKGQFFVQCRLNPKFTNPREQNFALAHMLGHVFFDLHPKMANGELQRSIFEEAISPSQRFAMSGAKVPKEEALCDAFAAALLLPRAMLKKAYSTLASRQDTAAFFQVEAGVLERRLEQLGMKENARAAEPESKSTKAESRRAHSQNAEAALSKASAKAKAERENKRPSQPPSNSRPAADAKFDSRPEPKARRPESSAVRPETAEAGKKPSPSGPKPTADSQSSMTRVARNVAALSYRREEQRQDAVEDKEDKTDNKGLDRLRQIAKKIDKSVDV